MSQDKLDLTQLDKTIRRLQEGLARYRSDVTDIQIRDGLIQRFEFTYEISHKTLKRFLKLASATPLEFDDMSFQELIRTANERELLLGDWPQWKGYRDMHSKTSQSYKEDVALEVVAGIPGFLEEAVYLQKRLHERQA